MSINVEDYEAGIKELESQYRQLRILSKHDRTSEVATLRKALKVMQDLVDRTASRPDLDCLDRHAGCVFNLGNCQKELFDATNDLTHLDKAIDAGRESFLAASESTQLKVAGAAYLSDYLAKRYFAKGIRRNDKDLQDALEMARLAVASLHEGSPLRQFALSALANRLGDFYQFFGGDCYLDEAIKIGRELVSEPSDSRAVYWGNLGNNLKTRAGRYGKMEAGIEDLMAAKACFTEALDAFPKRDINHVVAARALADCLIDIAKNTNEAHWLDEANRLLTPLEHETTSKECLANIYRTKSKLYNRKYDMHGKVSDLTMAVEAAEEGLRRISPNSPYRAYFLETMSQRLATRAQLAMSQEDIHAAIEYATEYLALAWSTPAMLPEAFNALGTHLRTKYSLFGDVQNLAASIYAHRITQSLLRRGLLPEDDDARPTRFHNLATALGDYFDYTGEVEWLNEAIQLNREAASKLEDSSPVLSTILDALSGSLWKRNKLTGHARDLVEAVSVAERAVACAVVGSKGRCVYLNRLSIVLQDRYQVQGNIKDLDRAVVVALEAISASGGDQYRELCHESTYAGALEKRHRANGDMRDLDLAIVTLRKVVAKTPESSSLRIGFMHNLGMALEEKYRRFKGRDNQLAIEALQEAHDLAQQCDNETAKDDETTPTLLHSLAHRQFDLAMARAPLVDYSDGPLILAQLKLSATTYQRAFNKIYDTTLHRILAGKNAGDLYMSFKEWDTASKILSECVNMFHRVSPISLTEDDRQLRLRDLSGTSSQACASYLAQGKIEQGIEIFEAGRGVMASIAMRTQDDCVAVKEADANLHARYIRTRQALSQPLDNEVSSSRSQDVVAKRTAAMKELEEIENQIRAISGLEKFNKGLSSNELRALAVHGPLIAFCTVNQRCDALIVTTEGIQALPLPDLKMVEIEMRVQLVVGRSRLSKAKPTKQVSANKRMRALLSWLWDAVASPVLEHLGLTQGPANEPKPRLWWVTSGQLGLLPLHAAGKGKRQPGHNVFAHVISSYVPSFEALAFARERQSRLGITSSRIALVTMPQTPGNLANLDTDEEAHAIREVFGFVDSSSRSAQFLEFRQCSVEKVVHHLQSTTADIFHFACHAQPDPNDPSNTSLLLGSDPTAPSPDLLPIRELRKLNGPSGMRGPPPRLAYLSACCTAQQYELRLIDESIHLAAAFQLLGFPAVVGTLWEADDRAAVVVARAFYQELFRLDESACQGTSQFLPGDLVARALHFAVSTYRQQETDRVSVADNVLLWANFVHIGA